MAKSLPLGFTAPRLAHATIRLAASVCGSAVAATVPMATSTACRRSVTAASRSRQNFPTPPWHSRPRAVIASPRAACATERGDGQQHRGGVTENVTASVGRGVTRVETGAGTGTTAGRVDFLRSR
jgi:hypothetical protein